jgi:hypothetical protein
MLRRIKKRRKRNMERSFIMCRTIKSRRMEWEGQVARMGEMRPL